MARTPAKPWPVLGDVLQVDIPEKYTLGAGTWQALQRKKRRNEGEKQGYGYSVCPVTEATRTLTAGYAKDGSEILIGRKRTRPLYTVYAPDDQARTLTAGYRHDPRNTMVETATNPRRLTPRECARLMGFPDSFVLPCSDTQSYKQLGNSVVVPLVTAIVQA